MIHYGVLGEGILTSMPRSFFSYCCFVIICIAVLCEGGGGVCVSLDL